MRATANRLVTRARGLVPVALILAGCTSADRVPSRSAGTPVAEAKAAAAGREPDAAPPRESAARGLDGYKRDAARRIYYMNAASLFDGAPPPLLKSVVVLAIRLDADGKPVRVAIVRSNGYPELEDRALRSVRTADPLPVPRASLLTRGFVEYYETWLFRDDHRFQIRSLAQAQEPVE